MKRFIIALVMIAMFVGVAVAQTTTYTNYPNIGIHKIGVKVGPALPDNPYNVGFAFAINADFGNLHEVLGLEGTVEYMRMTKTVLETYTNSLTDFSGIATLKVMPNIESLPFDPYIGGGLGIHYYMSKLDERQSGVNEEPGEMRLELHLALGATMPLKEGITGIFTFKMNFSDISTYNPYIGVMFDM
ncbi:MAG: hypothetical protein ACP5G4_07230 [bacterium]